MFNYQPWLLVLIWGILFFPLISGQISIGSDTFNNYAVTKYFWNNILNGTWPLWDPYLYYGRPFLAFATAGVLNPLSMAVPLLVSFGADYLQAYLCYLAVFLLVGALGFRALAGEIYKDELALDFSFLAFLLSGMSVMLFTQINIILIFVPAVWFILSVVRFVKAPTGAGCLHVIFWSMIALVSYFPFYLVCVTAIFAAVGLVVYGPARSWTTLGPALGFLKRDKKWILLGALSLIVALAPLVLARTWVSEGSYTSPSRQMFAIGEDNGSLLKPGLSAMDMKQAGSSSSIAIVVGPRSFVSHLEGLDLFRDSFFYMPTVIWLVIVAAAFILLDQRGIFLLFSILFTVQISFGNFSSIYKALFSFLPFFAWFRNLFFLMGFIIPLLILFAAGQLVGLLGEAVTAQRGVPVRIKGTLACLGYFVILFFVDDVSPVTWIASAAMGTVLIGALWIRGMSYGFWKWTLLLCLVIEPAMFFPSFLNGYRVYSIGIPSGHSFPDAGLTRRPGRACTLPAAVKEISYPQMCAEMAFEDRLFAPSRSGDCSVDLISYPVAQYLNADLKAAQDVVKYKFLVIDQDAEASGREVDMSRARPVEEDNSTLRITGASVNGVTLRTGFRRNVELVYTDAFDPHWQAWIDGQKVVTRPTAEGFKAIMVPSGAHTVEMQYRPLPWPWVMWAILGYFYLMGAACLLAGCGKRGGRDA